MAEPVTIDRLHQFVGQPVRLQGWLYNSRHTGKILFLIIRDGTGLCQCVIQRNDQNNQLFEQARRLPQESSLELVGTVRADSRAIGGYELAVTDLNVVQLAEQYPITPKPHGIDFLMKHRHLWLRSRRPHAILRIRHSLVDAIRRFFNDRGFVLIDSPLLAPAIGEAAATLFEVDYFGQPVYLAQTGQLYLEAACMAFRKVYCFGPTFRAEKSKTRRHLTEFWMVEPELAYADLDEVIDLAEQFVRSIVERILQHHRPDLQMLGRDVSALERATGPFVRISYDQAVELLRGPRTSQLLDEDRRRCTLRLAELDRQIQLCQDQATSARQPWQQDRLAQQIARAREEQAELTEQLHNIPNHLALAQNFQWGKDLGGSDETIISRLFDRPVIVHHYPRQAKAFYMKTDPARPQVVENFDLLAPEGYGEIIGGSQREDDLQTLIQRIDEHQLPRDAYDWYLDLRRYGSVPHGGFGLGLERTLAWICGLKHIREAIPFPRMMGRLYP